MMYLFVALGCPHCTPPSAVSPYSGQWPSTFGLSHVAVSSQHGWDKGFVSIFAKAKIISLITCTANTDYPCFRDKGKESHQSRQNLSMPHPAWWYGVAFHPIDAMRTYLISPCLLSIQYWFPPWLWQGQRPTGLCRSSLFPGLLGNTVSNFQDFYWSHRQGMLSGFLNFFWIFTGHLSMHWLLHSFLASPLATASPGINSSG